MISTLTSSDILIFFGGLISAWSLGFTGGYLITTFKRAIDAAT